MGNAPKYAIDSFLTEFDQACYNYLFMPCFVINLFVGFALQPLLVKMSQSWIHKDYKNFLYLCGSIFAGAAGIASIVVVAGRAIGCQILSFVFGIKLIQYVDVLTVLLVGGGFFAFAVIEQVVLTVMRRQMFLLVGFVMASIIAFIISDPLVKKFGLLGAGWAYTISAGTLFIVLAFLIIFFWLNIDKEK